MKACRCEHWRCVHVARPTMRRRQRTRCATTKTFARRCRRAPAIRCARARATAVLAVSIRWTLREVEFNFFRGAESIQTNSFCFILFGDRARARSLSLSLSLSLLLDARRLRRQEPVHRRYVHCRRPRHDLSEQSDDCATR